MKASRPTSDHKAETPDKQSSKQTDIQAERAALPPLTTFVSRPGAIRGRPVPTPTEVLALQRTIGNTAIQRQLKTQIAGQSIQTQEATDVEPAPLPVSQTSDATLVQTNPGGEDEETDRLESSMLEFTGGHVQFSGPVHSEPVASDGTVMIQAPLISYDATVSLASGVSLGADQFILVGPVQTLHGSERTAVYRQGGNPQGAIVAERHVSVREVRDAMYDQEGAHRRPQAPAPWYARPERLSDVRRTQDVEFRDQPDFTVPSETGGGRLTETRGQDRFTTSLAAKRGDNLIHLISYQWSIPWNVTINAQGEGQGEELLGGPSEEGPSRTTGPTPLTATESWLTFSSVDAAMAENSNTLLTYLTSVYEHDLSSWYYIIEALRRKNPLLHAEVSVDETADPVGRDEIMVRATGNLPAPDQGPFSLGAGESQDLTFNFNDLFRDAAAIDARSRVWFRVWDGGTLSHPPMVRSWPYPFDPQRTLVAMEHYYPSQRGNFAYRIKYRFSDR